MRVLVTGANGFVGRWMVNDLEASGHRPIAATRERGFEAEESDAIVAFVREAEPDGIVHLAAITSIGDATSDPERAHRVNVLGTGTVIEAAAEHRIPVLVSGSSAVYGAPDPADLPLNEHAPLRPGDAYARSKLAQEQAALAAASARQVPVVVTRSFNHTGPGQRPEFVAPALVSRVLAAAWTGNEAISVGNLSVERDIGDVRDVVRAYRLLLEGLGRGSVPSGTIVNVATGRTVSIGELLDLVLDVAGASLAPRADPALQRDGEAPRIVGDPSLLRSLTGWSPEIDLRTTIADLTASIIDRSGSKSGRSQTCQS